MSLQRRIMIPDRVFVLPTATGGGRAVTGGGNNETGPSAAFEFSLVSMLAVMNAAGDGSALDADGFVQAKVGKSWFDVPYDLRLRTSTGATEPTVDATKRNIMKTQAAANDYDLGVFKSSPFGSLRFVKIGDLADDRPDTVVGIGK